MVPLSTALHKFIRLIWSSKVAVTCINALVTKEVGSFLRGVDLQVCLEHYFDSKVKYFFDPSGRKFRSKHEVLHFLETGKKLKRNADDLPSGSKKSKKSSSMPLDILKNVQANPPQKT